MSDPHNVKLDRNTDALQQLALDMGRLAEAILEKSLHSVWELDAKLAAEVKQDDLPIDRLDLAIDDAVLRVLALDAPVARDLRLVVAVKSIATDLERVGDLARNIASCAERLASQPGLSIPDGLRKLAADSRTILRHAIQAFSDLDADAARRVLDEDDVIDDLEDELIRDSINRLASDPGTTEQEVDFIFIAQHLERVGDHATNIAEETVLAAEAINLKHSSKLGGA
jgi:phosphate transport system protein